MSNITKDFITKMRRKSAFDCKTVAEAVDELLKAPSPDEVIKHLLEASRQFDDNTLGYFIFPGLREKIAKDKALMPVIQKLVNRRDVPANVRMHCIDLIDKLFREKQASYPTDYVDFICDTAVNPKITMMVRTRIARLLARVPGRKQIDALRILVDSKKARLVEAACHTMSRWSKEKLTRHGDLVKQIMGFVEGSPEGAIKNPNILRTLARSNKRGLDRVLDKVITKTSKEEDWLRLAACIGPGSPTKQLAKIINGIQGIKDKVGPQSQIAIRNLFKKDPSQLESLYKEKYYTAFIESLAADPGAIRNAGLSYLDNIERKADSIISKTAAKLKQELTTAKLNAFLPKEVVLGRKGKTSNPGIQPPITEKIHESYGTGFHMGDALYRDTYLKEPFTHNHWHAGIFQTFEFMANDGGIDGHMQGVHMTGFPGDVKPFKAKRGFGNPNCIVAEEMKKLFDKFLKDFEVDKKHPYHGARRTPDMSKDDRLNLLKRSADLMNRGIHYTFWDMLVSWGDDWDGTVSDIDLLRCDGVVEYTYEKCGKKVCAGTEVSKWNIAAAGNAYLQSHEDLHTWDLDPGELCPRVQAGNEGNDTTFIKPKKSVPIVQEFVVEKETVTGGEVIAIKLNVQSSEYYNVYVRIIVGPSGGPFHFAITTGAPRFPSGIAGKWMFKEVDEGTDHVAYWPGDTSGQDYYGTNAIYEFRAVAVDKGGNVSEEYSCKIPINWSQILPKPW